MNTVIVPTLVLLLLATGAVQAQVPQLINYQGRVAVGGVNFDGSGQFKFALVDDEGTTTHWSNDDTSTSGREPSATVTLAVTEGLYSALLGNVTLPNMTIVPAAVFSNADVRLRVWFNDGTNGSQLLTPDQRIATVGYAMMPGNMLGGAITGAKIAASCVGGTQINGAVGNAQVATNGPPVTSANAASESENSGNETVSSAAEDAAPFNADSVRIATTTTVDAWQERFNGTPPTGSFNHTAVWTGSEMIVWGGGGAPLFQHRRSLQSCGKQLDAGKHDRRAHWPLPILIDQISPVPLFCGFA
ncbi:MAG: hypothetical protein ACR2OZ_16540 [Verrucomicrobiales bacterium]